MKENQLRACPSFSSPSPPQKQKQNKTITIHTHTQTHASHTLSLHVTCTCRAAHFGTSRMPKCLPADSGRHHSRSLAHLRVEPNLDWRRQLDGRGAATC